MDSTYYTALLAGYAAALGLWLVLARFLPGLWPRRDAMAFAHPWREVGWALLAGAAVVGVGQLYTRGWLLPGGGPRTALAEATNQLLIFSPILALPLIRRQGWRSAWLPLDRVWLRVLVGGALGALAILAFSRVHPGSDRWLEILPRVYAPVNVGMLAQVLCEDVAIAILFVRLRAALGLAGSVLLVALLFAAAHIPAMVAEGASTSELGRLGLDAGLGVAIILVLQRSADVWWFWGVHFAMDMLQFHSGAPPPG